MPKVGETDLDVLKRDAFMFLIFENSMNISEETLTILNREMLDFIRSIFEVQNNTDMQVKIIAMEFNDKCWIKCGPVYLNEFSAFEIKPSDKAPDFGNMLYVLNSVIKDLYNRSFTKWSFYAPIFIFVTAGPKDKEYLSALDPLSANRIYKYGTKIAVAVEDGDNIESIADIVGSAEAVITKDNIKMFSQLLRFNDILVDSFPDWD